MESLHDVPPPYDQVAPPRDRGVSRTRLDRDASAKCLMCDWTDYTSWALARGSEHVRTRKHVVDGTYQTRILYTPEETA
jgi:hypothetical protein